MEQLLAVLIYILNIKHFNHKDLLITMIDFLHCEKKKKNSKVQILSPTIKKKSSECLPTYLFWSVAKRKCH